MSEKLNWEQLAGKAWAILTKLAAHNGMITYEELAQQLDIHHRLVSRVLDPIQSYYMSQDQEGPPLTILVVNKSSNRPGSGFIAWEDINYKEGRRRVCEHDWSADINPFSYSNGGITWEELKSQLLTSRAAAKDVYRKVKDRGQCQLLFRDALIEAYDGKCALTGVSVTRALDAAHILPWSECSDDLKLAPQNGLLILASHHRLFDAGLIFITSDWHVFLTTDFLESLKGGNEANSRLFEYIHGRQIVLPADRSLWPDPELIKRRYDRNKHGQDHR